MYQGGSTLCACYAGRTPTYLYNPDCRFCLGPRYLQPILTCTPYVSSLQFFASEARYVYTTPKSYLELLKLYTSLLEKKHIEADAAIQRLEGGVLKLAESAEAVASLEENLKVVSAVVCLR